MKKSMLPLAVAALLVAATAPAGQLSETMDTAYPLAADGRVSVENVNGFIRIVGSDRADVRVQAVRSADTRACLDDLRVQVDATPTTVRIDTRYPSEGHGWLFSFNHCDCRVEYTISVPRTARIDRAEMVNGDIEVEGVTGTVAAENVNGDVILGGLAGDLRASTVNGRIEASWTSLAKNASVEAESVNGRVELTLPNDAAARVHAESVNGRIRSEFPGLEAERSHRYGPGSRLDGTIGGGGASVEASTVNGAITVSPKDTAAAGKAL